MPTLANKNAASAPARKTLTAEEGFVATFEEVKPSFYVSAAFHFIILLLIIFGLPMLPQKKIEMPEPISVEMINPSDMARTNHVDEPTPKPEEPKSVVTPPEPPKPPPPPTTPPPTPTPPAPQTPPTPPTPVEPVPEIKPLTQQLPPIPPLGELPPIAKPMQIVKPQPAPKPPAPQSTPPDKQKVQQQDQQFDTLLKNLSQPVPKQAPPDQPIAKQAAKAAAARAPIASVLTADEMALVRERLKACWIVPAGAYNADSLSIDVQATFNPDATLKSETLIDTNDRYNRDTYFKAAADSALRALRNPACDPLPLPPGKYDQWSSMTFRFDPKEMLAP